MQIPDFPAVSRAYQVLLGESTHLSIGETWVSKIHSSAEGGESEIGRDPTTDRDNP
jgi:hypothetical protein